MIVRTILDIPELAEDFDYFNDFANTMDWLSGLDDSRSAAAKKMLSAGHSKWLNRRSLDDG